MLVLLPLLTRWFFYLVYTMENNYSVYQHVTPDGMYYFGQSQNVERRWRNNGAEYKETALQPYIEKYGWDNIKHIVLFRDQTRKNALWIEDFLIETAQEDGVCINQQRSGNISKDEDYHLNYRQENREHYRLHREENREHYREMRREHYQKNKDKIREYNRQYREEHKEQMKEYRRKNRDKINEQRRQRYQRKKLEKQLKEAVETTLF